MCEGYQERIRSKSSCAPFAFVFMKLINNCFQRTAIVNVLDRVYASGVKTSRIKAYLVCGIGYCVL